MTNPAKEPKETLGSFLKRFMGNPKASQLTSRILAARARQRDHSGRFKQHDQ